MNVNVTGAYIYFTIPILGGIDITQTTLSVLLVSLLLIRLLLGILLGLLIGLLAILALAVLLGVLLLISLLRVIRLAVLGLGARLLGILALPIGLALGVLLILGIRIGGLLLISVGIGLGIPLFAHGEHSLLCMRPDEAGCGNLHFSYYMLFSILRQYSPGKSPPHPMDISFGGKAL